MFIVSLYFISEFLCHTEPSSKDLPGSAPGVHFVKFPRRKKAMGFLISSTVANLFVEEFETKAIRTDSPTTKPRA